ncbi:hypothetical protein VNO77_31060 [Canavalia gladiata]|uniref:Uncharacterized protein n=1 Tax=Canavalia gladiata TaxID=3824 RepID=A0AAN9KQR4_CANGL
MHSYGPFAKILHTCQSIFISVQDEQLRPTSEILSDILVMTRSETYLSPCALCLLQCEGPSNNCLGFALSTNELRMITLLGGWIPPLLGLPKASLVEGQVVVAKTILVTIERPKYGAAWPGLESMKF